MNVLSIQSHVAYGHVGNSAAVFVLQRLGFEVWPVHTVQYSNHKGYGDWAGQDFSASHIRDVVEGLGARGALGACDAVLSGYLGQASLGAAVLEAVARVRRANPDALYACDPVMGDDAGGLYVPEDIPEFFRTQAAPRADIVTPNRFELELLSERPVHTLGEALSAARAVRARGPAVVLVTSLRHATTEADEIEMLALDARGAWRLRTPYLALDPVPNGAGDALAALFLAHYLSTRDCARALEAAGAAIFAVVAATQAAGTRELQLVAAQDGLVYPKRRFTIEAVA